MSDLTHDAEDGFHEIQLSGKQLVFLFMATTVVLVATFLCGIMVGRGVTAARGDEAGMAAPISTAAASGEQPATIPSDDPPSPPAEDELGYHQRLQGSEPSGAGQKPAPQPAAAPPPAPAAAPRTERAAEGPDVPTSGQKGTWVVQVTALQNRGAAAGIVQRLIGKGYPAYLEMPASGAPAIYRVRIGRYPDRREAEQISRRLEKEEQFSPVVTR